MNEQLIKNILAEELFGKLLCESIDQLFKVNYYYKELLLESILFGEPMTVPELRKLLRQKILNFEFIKLSGEIRKARGTTNMKYIPQSKHPKGVRPASPKVATFFDLIKKDWRSVSQRSKEIVLKKDEATQKPVVVVLDKPGIKVEIGKTYEFIKLSKNKFNIPTYITITKKDDEGYWGKTSGSEIEILLNDEREKRLGPEIKIGETYEFTKLDKNKNKVFSTIKITRKDDEGYWGKTEGKNKEILLTNERLKRLGSNIKELEQGKEKEEITKEQPIVKPTVTLTRKNVPSTEKKIYHFRNKITGATVDFATDEVGSQNKLKQLGGNWEIISDEENKNKPKPDMMSKEGPEEKENLENEEGEELENES